MTFDIRLRPADEDNITGAALNETSVPRQVNLSWSSIMIGHDVLPRRVGNGEISVDKCNRVPPVASKRPITRTVSQRVRYEAELWESNLKRCFKEPCGLYR